MKPAPNSKLIRPVPTETTTLIAVTGLSPAIVTETIWRLAQEKPRAIPSRVTFITTGVGAGKLKEQLFTPVASFEGKTTWQALRAALKAKDDELIAEDPRIIGVANKKTGTFDPLDDIQTPEQNTLAAGFILEEVRRVVENPDTRLIASIAGGRKTMGALLHAAMTLIGRETDRITHVLVSAPYETMPGFFFPGQPGPALKDRDGKEHAPAKAQVQLADVPFVPLRNRFEDLRDMPGSFSGLVNKISRRIQQDADRPHLIEVNYRKKCLWLDDKPLPMRVKALAVLHYLADTQADGQTPEDQPAAAEGMTAWLSEADFIPMGVRPKRMIADDIRHELNHLRTALKKQGFEIAKRALHLPAHTLRLRD